MFVRFLRGGATSSSASKDGHEDPDLAAAASPSERSGQSERSDQRRQPWTPSGPTAVRLESRSQSNHHDVWDGQAAACSNPRTQPDHGITAQSRRTSGPFESRSQADHTVLGSRLPHSAQPRSQLDPAITAQRDQSVVRLESQSRLGRHRVRAEETTAPFESHGQSAHHATWKRLSASLLESVEQSDLHAGKGVHSCAAIGGLQTKQSTVDPLAWESERAAAFAMLHQRLQQRWKSECQGREENIDGAAAATATTTKPNDSMTASAVQPAPSLGHNNGDSPGIHDTLGVIPANPGRLPLEHSSVTRASAESGECEPGKSAGESRAAARASVVAPSIGQNNDSAKSYEAGLIPATGGPMIGCSWAVGGVDMGDDDGHGGEGDASLLELLRMENARQMERQECALEVAGALETCVAAKDTNNVCDDDIGAGAAGAEAAAATTYNKAVEVIMRYEAERVQAQGQLEAITARLASSTDEHTENDAQLEEQRRNEAAAREKTAVEHMQRLREELETQKRGSKSSCAAIEAQIRTARKFLETHAKLTRGYEQGSKKNGGVLDDAIKLEKELAESRRVWEREDLPRFKKRLSELKLIKAES